MIQTHPLLPRMTDLQKVIDDIEKSGTDPQLVKMARSAWRAHSCMSELNIAHQMLMELTRSLDSGDSHTTPNVIVTQVALLNSIIVLYARATDTTSRAQNDRGPVDIRKDLSPSLRVDHQAIVALRNKAIAHVEANERVQELVWHESELLAIEVGKLWAPMVGVRLITVDRLTIARLQRLIPAAVQLLKKAGDKRLDALGRRLRERHNAAVQEALKDHPADPVARAGSLDAAIAMFGAPHRRGIRAGFTNSGSGGSNR